MSEERLRAALVSEREWLRQLVFDYPDRQYGYPPVVSYDTLVKRIYWLNSILDGVCDER